MLREPISAFSSLSYWGVLLLLRLPAILRRKRDVLAAGVQSALEFRVSVLLFTLGAERVPTHLTGPLLSWKRHALSFRLRWPRGAARKSEDSFVSLPRARCKHDVLPVSRHQGCAPRRHLGTFVTLRRAF